MFKNIILVLCLVIMGYSYLNNVSVKTMTNQAIEKAKDYSVKFNAPIVVEKS